MRYDVMFFPNGRIYFLDYDVLNEAIKNDKEILVVMNTWSGGCATARGVNKVPDCWYDDATPDKIAYEMYSYDIKDEEFTNKELSNFYKVIFTSGEMVRMKSGDEANSYCGHFTDSNTSFEKFKDSFRYNGETKDEFEKLRHIVDLRATVGFMRSSKDYKEKLKCLSGYSMFKGIEKYI